MKLSTASMSLKETPFRYSKGCWCWLRRRTPLKNGLQALRISLCACSCSSSQAIVMSKNSLSSLISLKAELIFFSKSFHLRQNFSEDISHESPVYYLSVSQLTTPH